MDEKGIKKILEIIITILKLTKAGTLKKQGFNDRLSVAKEIYQRNIDDEEFITALNKEITTPMEDLFELIIEKNENN